VQLSRVVTANVDEEFEALKEDLKPEKSSSGLGPSKTKNKSKTSRWELKPAQIEKWKVGEVELVNDDMVRRSGSASRSSWQIYRTKISTCRSISMGSAKQQCRKSPLGIHRD